MITTAACTGAPPFPGVRPAEPTPVTGPTPTSAEIRAARERLALAPDRDVAAARILTARLAAYAAQQPPALTDLVRGLAALVADHASRHAGCSAVGCARCLYLTDAAAVVQAWKDGPS